MLFASINLPNTLNFLYLSSINSSLGICSKALRCFSIASFSVLPASKGALLFPPDGSGNSSSIIPYLSKSLPVILSADAASDAFAASLHIIDAHASGLATV